MGGKSRKGMLSRREVVAAAEGCSSMHQTGSVESEKVSRDTEQKICCWVHEDKEAHSCIDPY